MVSGGGRMPQGIYDMRRITLWLDMNSSRICWIDDNDENYKAQYRGESKNPLSIKANRPLAGAAGRQGAPPASGDLAPRRLLPAPMASCPSGMPQPRRRRI